MEPLTTSELAVARRLAYYGSNADIARELFISINTVKSHIKAIYLKLGVHDRGSAIVAATALGLLNASEP